MLCEYGCGQEATYQFKNGKWCCSKSHNSCFKNKNKNSIGNTGKSMSKESKIKISENNLGKIPWNKGLKNPYSKETLKLFSEAQKGKKQSKETIQKRIQYIIGKPRSIETKLKISLSNKGNIISNEHKKKLSISRKITIKQIQKRHPTFSKIEEMRYEPGKEKDKIIQVHCKNHNCINSKEKGGWFTPTGNQLDGRRRAIEDINGNGGGYFYCSEECKQECPLFSKRVSELIKEDKIKAGIIKEPIYNTSEYQVFRQEVLTRSNNLCEYCSKPAVCVHHSRPQKLEPFFSLDPDFGISCCQECHYKYGHNDECSTGSIASKRCI